MGGSDQPSAPSYVQPTPAQGLMPTAGQTANYNNLVNTQGQIDGNLNTLSPYYQSAMNNQLQAMQNQALNGYNYDYNNTITNAMNAMNARGIPTNSSIGSDDFGQVNRNYANGLANLNWSAAQAQPQLMQQYQNIQNSPLNYINPQIAAYNSQMNNAYNYGLNSAQANNNFNLGTYNPQMSNYMNNNRDNAMIISAALGAGGKAASGGM